MNLQFESAVRAPVHEVFEFHQDPANLAVLMADWPGLKLLHHGGPVRPGSELWIEQTVGGWIPIALGFRHTECNPPHRFGECLIHGPFSRFNHIHEFESNGTGCIVRDLLDVGLPWYFGGESMVKTSIAPVLHRAFALRQRALDQLFVLTG